MTGHRLGQRLECMANRSFANGEMRARTAKCPQGNSAAYSAYNAQKEGRVMYTGIVQAMCPLTSCRARRI